MSFFSDKWRGIILCAVLAVPCWFLGKLVPVVGAPVFAILLGMLVALVWPVEAAFKSGVGFVSKKGAAIRSNPAWLRSEYFRSAGNW